MASVPRPSLHSSERLGTFITDPLLCGTNVAVRYLGVAADLITLPVGDNLISPKALDPKPPVRLP